MKEEVLQLGHESQAKCRYVNMAKGVVDREMVPIE